MENAKFSQVEKYFLNKPIVKNQGLNVPAIVVGNFPELGFLTALRFLEWVSENPNGIISLPTGKTPEYFIVWTVYLLENWDNEKGRRLREKYGLSKLKKPRLSNLQFVQIDEFYPISSKQHNSFNNFVSNYYIKGFGLKGEHAQLINCDEIRLVEDKHYSEIFPDSSIDLTLRYREPRNSLEALQQKSIFLIDAWCTRYEDQIRSKGGIGFFLGGIGPDGHIAFNTRGSDFHSATRLTETNFETQAVAAGDLGGIEIARNRLVITIGLETICYNPHATALIFAAGDSKASVVRDALVNTPSNLYPASVLHKLPNARFYLTAGAASLLPESIDTYYRQGDWSQEKTDRAVMDLCTRLDKYAHHLTLEDLRQDTFCKMIPGLSEKTVQTVIDSITEKIQMGTIPENNQMYLHTGPHHDDIMLGILPHIHRLLRNESNKAHFTVLTSGFTAVTNTFIIQALEDAKRFLAQGLIQMTEYPDFFSEGFKYKHDKDVYHYLIKVASGEPFELKRGLSHRLVRAITEIYKVKNKDDLRNQINDILSTLRNSYDGEKNPPAIQTLKGMVREFEEELVWAYFGIQTKDIHHLRLGFYTGDIFTEQPNRKRDVLPLLEQLREIKPTVISLAFDPEGSGPDTHYKVLQVIADAVRLWRDEEDISKLRIWGYRNVWYRFHPASINRIVPVSLNAMAVMDNSFTNSYLSQVEASFPSYQYNGKFSELTKRIWVEQLKTIQLILGKNYFYQHNSPRIRATHGLLFYKEMSVDDFLMQARELERSMEGKVDAAKDLNID